MKWFDNIKKKRVHGLGAGASILAVVLSTSVFSTAVQASSLQDQPKNAKAKDQSKDSQIKDGLTYLPLIKEKKISSPLRLLPMPKATAGVGEPGLSLRIKKKKVGDNFFYLKDQSEGTVVAHSNNKSSFPYFASGPLDNLKLGEATLNQAVLGYNSSQLGLIFSPKDKANPYGTGFELALQSSMYLTVNHELLDVSEAFLDREYAIGLSLGYYGFKVDASFLEQNNNVNPEFSGYGVGLSYSTKKLWTRLGYKDLNARPYSQTVASLSDRLITSDLSSLELQAAYNLTNSIRLMGGLRYSIYGDPLIGSTVYRDNNQSVYLGTRWSF